MELAIATTDRIQIGASTPENNLRSKMAAAAILDPIAVAAIAGAAFSVGVLRQIVAFDAETTALLSDRVAGAIRAPTTADAASAFAHPCSCTAGRTLSQS